MIGLQPGRATFAELVMRSADSLDSTGDIMFLTVAVCYATHVTHTIYEVQARFCAVKQRTLSRYNVVRSKSEGVDPVKSHQQVQIIQQMLLTCWFEVLLNSKVSLLSLKSKDRREQ